MSGGKETTKKAGKDDASKAPAEQAKKKDAKKKAKKEVKPLTPWEELRANTELLAKGVVEKDDRIVNRAIRSNTRVRYRLTAANLLRSLEFVPNDAQSALGVRAFVDAVAEAEAAANTDADVDMSGDSGAGAGAGAGAADAEAKTADKPAEKPVQSSKLPEIHAYIQLLALDALFKYKLNSQALAAARSLVAYLSQFNRRSLDIFGAKAYAALSLANEKLGTLDSIRSELMRAHRTASLRHDEMGKATLLNLLLRNYLHYNLYEQANKLRLRATFPDSVSNNQYVRWLYYIGRIDAVRLDYSDAHASLQQAARKAPSHTAVGFRCAVHRLIVVVKLLMGETPDRSVFREKGLRIALRPHFLLTQAVRVGDLPLFNRVLAEHADDFKSDSSYSLILRLRNNVIKAGLRKIAVAYSTISFDDIAEKLQLDSAEDAAFLAAKAIKDGVIDASLDDERNALVSRNTTDLYSTVEPQLEFHKRIRFCLDVHHEAVKGMIYPPNAHRAKREAAVKEEDEVDEEAIAAAAAEEDEDEDEDDE